MEGHTPIGRVNYRNDNRIFGIKDTDRFGHVYCIGKTGTGKSTLMMSFAISDIERGHGCAILDPHSDLAEKLLDYVPQKRIDDVIYFSPSDETQTISFNPLWNVAPENHHLVCSGLISTFKNIWKDSWGPRLEYILRFCLLTLLEYRRGTILDIQTLLTDKDFRNDILSDISNKGILDFWYKEFEKYAPNLKSEATAPILNKIGVFTSNAILQRIVGQKCKGLDFKLIMNERKILVANLSKGLLGEDISSLLGNIIVNAFQLEALNRARQEEQYRIPFFLYVDECHSYVSAFEGILSEARKYKLGLFLTNQYIDQLSEDVRNAIFGNVGTLIAFRIGAQDAQYIIKEFEPAIVESDLVNLPRFNLYLKLMIDGSTSKVFSAETIALKPSKKSFKQEILLLSRNQFGSNEKSMTEGSAFKYSRKETGHPKDGCGKG